jgi:hypothetical protein
MADSAGVRKPLQPVLHYEPVLYQASGSGKFGVDYPVLDDVTFNCDGEEAKNHTLRCDLFGITRRSGDIYPSDHG